MNTIVNFEIAKLLKEKGFDKACSHYYVLDFQNFKADGVLQKTKLPNDWHNPNILQFAKRDKQPHLANAPTIAEVVMWFYEKHNIIIESHWEGTPEIDSFDARIIVLGKHILSKEYKDFKLGLDASSPTEAYQEAILYTLKILI